MDLFLCPGFKRAKKQRGEAAGKRYTNDSGAGKVLLQEVTEVLVMEIITKD